MTTGYQAQAYADLSRAADALELLASSAEPLERIARALERLASQGEIQGLREARRDRPFELSFHNTDGMDLTYEARHATVEDAVEAAQQMLAGMPNRAAHSALIHGPGLGPAGRWIQ